jgi:hypothetical protein
MQNLFYENIGKQTLLITYPLSKDSTEIIYECNFQQGSSIGRDSWSQLGLETEGKETRFRSRFDYEVMN